MRSLSPKLFLTLKIILFFLLLIPAITISVRVFVFGVADPVEYLTRHIGETGLQILILTLMVTPFQRISGWNWVIKLRRMIGLYAFFYIFCHFLVYLFLDLMLNFGEVIEDVIERRYITVGFLAFLLLIPLAITSNDFLIKKIGGKTWLKIHKCIYAIVPLGILHFLWQIKGNHWEEAALYGVIVFFLLLLRYPVLAKKIKR